MRPVAAAAEPAAPAICTSLACLSFAARRHGVDVPVEHLVREYATDGAELSPVRLARVAKEAGLRARPARARWPDLSGVGGGFPVLARLNNGNWVVLTGIRGEGPAAAAVLHDPLAAPAEELEVPKEKFLARWQGEILLVKRSSLSGRRGGPAPGPGRERFGLAWFAAELVRQRRIFADVVVAALFLYALGLAAPIFFQLVIDKVLVHQSVATLEVLAAGVAIALLFEAAFTFLRRYLLIYATNRVDIRVATRTFAHLLRLPIGFFERLPAGVIVRHLQQAGRIREFLTGRLFLTGLDACSLFVFIPVLFLYSARLASVVLLFTLLTALVIALLVAPFRRRLTALYEAEGERQALLVQSVHGMRTVKSLAMEPQQRRAWDDCSARAVSMRYQVEKVSALAQAATGLLEKLAMVAIVGLGAMAVFDGSLTIGALVAFNMLAGRVSGPLTQMVTMVHEYQDVALSIRMLGEVMNHPPERDDRAGGIRPPLRGEVEFQDVSFRYASDLGPSLDGVSFRVPAGTILGVVGRSGSGKTTLTRLIQGLYTAQQGLVRVDGFDVRELDPAHLRGSIGTVLQENFLFRGTVRENIAAPRPGATFEEVVAAARQAGAEEFIARLPQGFDTHLEENAENLSGGQKQRLAIARALITDPRLLILDEATSALDPESEVIVRRNLRGIARGRTVIIVSHRLATLVDSHAIVVMERGRIADVGRHAELLNRCGSYAALWSQQIREVA